MSKKYVHEHEAVFFDLDGTIVNQKTEQAFALHLFKKGHLSLKAVCAIIFTYLKYDLGLLKNYSAAKERLIAHVFSGRRVVEVETLYKTFFKQSVEPKLFSGWQDAYRQHINAGRKVFIVSATIDLIGSCFAQHIPVEKSCFTCLEIKDGQYTGNVSTDVMYGKVKKECVYNLQKEFNLDLRNSYAYGDYNEDRYMLSAVGNPVAVNPDKKLRQLALQKKWEIVNWQ